MYYFFGDKIHCGDRFKATVELSDIDEEYKLYNYGNGVYTDCHLKEIDEYYSSSTFFSGVGKARRHIIDTICKNFTGDIAGILIALNSGDKSYISDELYSKVLICGLSHIMVVSGLHLSIVIGSVFVLLEKFIYNRFFKSIFSLLMIFLICALCGFKLSILRAGIMFVFSAVSPMLFRKNDSVNSLGSAVLLLLFISPLCIFSVAFQLSVSATLAVVYVAPFYSDLITRKLRIRSKTGGFLVSVFTVSIAAMIFTAPISIYVFGKISVLSPAAFLLVTFPVTYALEFNTAALLLSSIKGLSFLSKPLFLISGLSAMYIRFIINSLGMLDFMLINVGIVGFFVSLFLIFVLIVPMYLINYYLKLSKRNRLSEVKNRAGNLRKCS